MTLRKNPKQEVKKMKIKENAQILIRTAGSTYNNLNK
jgi:hypothetical protein